MEIIELKKQIQSGNIKNIYLFTGDELYLIESYTDMIAKHWLDSIVRTINYDFMDECKDIDKILNACISLPMFSNKKMVVVKNSGLFQKKKEDIVDITEYAKNPSDFTCLVFIESKIDKRNTLYKAISKSGVFFEFDYRNPDELSKWVLAMTKKHQKTINRDAIIKLIFNCDNGMHEIENELNKLLLYCKDKTTITIDDVNKVCVRSVKAGIFELTDAIVAGDNKVAFKKLYDLLYLKEPPFMIFFMISRQFMMLNDIYNMKKQNCSLKEISSKMKTPDFITRKNIANAEKYKFDNLKKAVNLLSKMDLDIKSGNITVETSLDCLIHSLSNKSL